MRASTTILALTTLLTACGEQSSKITVGAPTGEAACDLTLDKLAGTEWLFLRANPDKSETPDYKTRLKFIEEGGVLKAKYNVGSISSMYDYGCTRNENELLCVESPKVKDWCQALLVGGSECTAEIMKSYDGSLTDEQVKKGMDEAIANYEKYKNSKDPKEWESFKLNNNNLGNKLQGRLYVKIDDRHCRLRITDNYMTIYNGKRMEDSNPAGTNPFVKNDQGELLWENCENAADLIALKEAGYPKDPKNVGHYGRHAPGADVFFWDLSEKTLVPEEGCDYNGEIWVDGKPWKKDYKPVLVDVRKGKELHWGWSNKWAEPTLAPLVTVLVKNKTCNGKTEKVEVSCNAVLITNDG